jgi:hypothetical protein
MSANGLESGRRFWLRQLTAWHWITAAISLLGMAGFAFTGITLNHAADMVAHPVIHDARATLPAPLQSELTAIQQARRRALPPRVAGWLDQQFGTDTAQVAAEWSPDEVYFTLKGPGIDAWIRIDRGNGAVEYQRTQRGWIAVLNDLHKGRDTGAWWRWFIDLFAAACVLFSLTGFALLWLKAPGRRSTWPLLGIGVIIPLVIVLFLLH